MFPNNHIIESFVPDEEAALLVKTHHYLHSLPRGTKRSYSLYIGRSLCGVALFGVPVGKGYSPDTIELKRFVLKPGMPKNSASWFLSQCIKLLKCSEWKNIITFADPKQGHTGVIYKATNFKYEGVQKYKTPVLRLKKRTVYMRNINNRSNKDVKRLWKAGALKIQWLPPKHKFTMEL